MTGQMTSLLTTQAVMTPMGVTTVITPMVTATMLPAVQYNQNSLTAVSPGMTIGSGIESWADARPTQAQQMRANLARIV